MKHLTQPDPAPRHWRDIPQRPKRIRRWLRRVALWIDGMKPVSKNQYEKFLK